MAKSLIHPFIKVYNFIQREWAPTSIIENQGKFIPYLHGSNNNFPQELASLVQGSPTATSCLSTLTDFIAGEGFNLGEDLENLVLNPQGLTFSQFNAVCADSMAHDWGVASIIKYNGAGRITQVHDIPFGYCRLGLPDDKGIISKIKYNPYFGTSLYQVADNEEYDVYNPKAAPIQFAKDKKWKGQIFWMAIKTRKHPFYPVPDYYSAAPWMRTERNAGIYFDENLENGFLQDIYMKMIGDPNEASGMQTQDGKDIPKGEAFDKEITGNFGRGAKTRHKLMALWGASKEEWPEIGAFPNSGNSDLFRVQDEHAIKKITIATKVPAILANVSEGVSLGGDGNTIRAAVKLMQQRVVRPQNLLINYYQEILRNLVNPVNEQIRITAYHPFPELETIDPQAWGVLTTEEKRKWVQDHTEIELIEPEQPVTAPTQASARSPKALHFNSYPKKARDNVKRALDWMEQDGNCKSTASAMYLSNAILSGMPLGPKDIRKLSNYLSKNVLIKDIPYAESCEAVKFYAWGGPEMMQWANEKVKELRGETD